MRSCIITALVLMCGCISVKPGAVQATADIEAIAAKVEAVTSGNDLSGGAPWLTIAIAFAIVCITFLAWIALSQHSHIRSLTSPNCKRLQ